jgi:hypothetical protein
VEPALPITDDLEPRAAPPLHGKAHPPAEMDRAVPTLDDEVALYHRPGDSGCSGFGFDPEAADAAADLAGDLGATFLAGATFGEDMSDDDLSPPEESELPLVLDESREDLPDDEGLPPLRSSRRRPRRGG